MCAGWRRPATLGDEKTGKAGRALFCAGFVVLQAVLPQVCSAGSIGKESGAALLARCEPAAWMAEAGNRRILSDEEYAQALSCLGFVDGFMWGHGWAAWREKRDMYYCPPEDLTAWQFVPTLVEYLRANPERLDARAHVLLFSALTSTYPCVPMPAK